MEMGSGLTVSRAEGEQLDLFDDLPYPDRDLKSDQYRRHLYGQFAERIAAKALDLIPVPQDARKDVCYDLQSRGTGKLFEVKSVKQGTDVAVWNWRMSKDRRCGEDALYCFVAHRAKPEGATTYRSAWEAYASTTDAVYVMSLHEVWDMWRVGRAGGIRTVKGDRSGNGNRVGYYRKGYRDGCRRIPLKLVAARCFELHSASEFALDGYRLRVDVKATPIALGKLFRRLG